MKIGMIGVGKLGLPLCLAIESKGHEVHGYDVHPYPSQYVAARAIPYHEVGAAEALATTKLKIHETIGGLVHAAEDIIFVAVQTPHDPAYEGRTPIPDTRADFDYGYLRKALAELSSVLEAQGVERTVVVISTVLPGTMRRYIMPGLSPRMRLCYSPSFIAMGTAMQDFLYPELVLFGVAENSLRSQLRMSFPSYSNIALEQAKAFFRTITDAPLYDTTIENAELIKVAYNTMISLKLAFANTLMEVCHKTPNTNVDAIVDALALAKRRLISPAYMRGGMGDGGGCHPRDNIALSWLARELDLSHDIFFDIMKAREDQTAWLADLVVAEHRARGLPIVLLGQAFKANTNISTGSPAMLLLHMLRERGYYPRLVDPVIHPEHKGVVQSLPPSVFVITTAHDCWHEELAAVPPTSTLIDPWRSYRTFPTHRDVRYIPVGVGPAL